MKKVTTMAIVAILAGQSADAKIWRVNNTPGANADFSTAAAAVAGAAAGDTLHLESSVSDYGAMNLNKKLVVRGTGYFLNETVNNPKTQFKKESAGVSTLTFGAGSKGSVVEGLSITNVNITDSLITLQRNYISSSINLSNARDVAGDTIRHNFIATGIYLNSGNFKTRGLFLYNNIITSAITFSTTNVGNVDGYAINNTFTGTGNYITQNFVYQNNIFNNCNFTTYCSSNTFLNNISVDALLPAGNGNVRSVPMTNLFVGGTTGTGFSPDGRYVLKAGSPAIGGGLLNGVAVDCGAFGGPAPYVLSGMPQMPSIYDITMPTQINSGTSTINISVSAAAH